MDKECAKYLLEKTREDYNLIAEDFSRTNEKVWPEFLFLFNNFLLPQDKILDLGCANGRFYELFKSKSTDYYGIDISEELVKIASSRYPEGKFQVADSLNLSFEDNFFDKGYCFAVLHHFPSKELRLQLFKEVKRVLKPGGIFIITTRKFHHFKDLFLLLKFTILKILGFSKLDFGDFLKPWGRKTKRYYHQFSEKELISLAKKDNFKIIKSGLLKHKERQNFYLIVKK